MVNLCLILCPKLGVRGDLGGTCNVLGHPTLPEPSVAASSPVLSSWMLRGDLGLGDGDSPMFDMAE